MLLPARNKGFPAGLNITCRVDFGLIATPIMVPAVHRVIKSRSAARHCPRVLAT